MKYVDGFVLAVSKDKLEDYRKFAQKAGEIWKKHGALEYFECVGDDMKPHAPGEECETLTFPGLINAKENEEIIFAFIVFESREHRDEVNKKVMNDPEMENHEMKETPFDVKRMAWGGFKSIVEE